MLGSMNKWKRDEWMEGWIKLERMDWNEWMNE